MSVLLAINVFSFSFLIVERDVGEEVYEEKQTGKPTL